MKFLLHLRIDQFSRILSLSLKGYQKETRFSLYKINTYVNCDRLFDLKKNLTLFTFYIKFRVIHLTTTTTKSCGCDLIFNATNIMSRNWSDIYRLLDEEVEQQSTRSGCSSIKTKNKFVQIIVQVRRSWRTLMSSLQPTLQQGNYSVSQRQQILTNISRLTNQKKWVFYLFHNCLILCLLCRYHLFYN